MKLLARMATAFLAGAAVLTGGGALAQAKPFKVYLSMSYIGNDWQAEAENMVKAMAASAGLKDKVKLEVQVSGPNAQRQIQQINAMVQAGAQAIVVYPISPTALNPVIRAACARHVVVIAYDAQVTEPCAYNVHINQNEAGTVTAQWLADKLGGKGNIVLMDGVPGTSVDTDRTAAAKAVFAKYPGIHVVAEGVGMWSQAVARTELSKIVATHPWKDIDGLWMQVGCLTATSMESEAGIKDDALKPCAGEGANGHRVQMLASGTAVDGAHGTYRPMGLPSISYASPPYSGALALKLAVGKLEGKPLAHDIVLPLPLAKNDTVKMCTTGSWKDMQGGCNVFQPAIISNPGWFAAIFSTETPEVGLQAALHATPEQ
ncbi:MAG TPA: sugar ABC transporter substrate-binding protein [Acidisoma sp.]|jgi:ribose transport system substrate-binding protein|uniref:sugar ABC transporter substrate-binding protein n=1 Tax=Acidisoma sp. TaxID=1872115 RepID=UPI002B67AA4D|nr:sugar ABC transporter substrate-binding protein [Acidisoma sp.]HTI02454.1 sugar ABC transporter substrate-binding protein [Acidisoma sp.]